MSESKERTSSDRMKELNQMVVDKTYKIISMAQAEYCNDNDVSNRERTLRNIDQFNDLVEHINSSARGSLQYHIKQYLLYVVCIRAKMLGIKKQYLLDALTKLRKNFDCYIFNGDKLITQQDLELAITGYTDLRKISNRRVEQITNINLSQTTKKELSKWYKSYHKSLIHEKRIVALKRYVKNGYSVEKMLQMLADNDLKISKTALYKNILYRMILENVSIRRNKKTNTFAAKERLSKTKKM